MSEIIPYLFVGSQQDAMHMTDVGGPVPPGHDGCKHLWGWQTLFSVVAGRNPPWKYNLSVTDAIKLVTAKRKTAFFCGVNFMETIRLYSSIVTGFTKRSGHQDAVLRSNLEWWLHARPRRFPSTNGTARNTLSVPFTVTTVHHRSKCANPLPPSLSILRFDSLPTETNVAVPNHKRLYSLLLVKMPLDCGNSNMSSDHTTEKTRSQFICKLGLKCVESLK